MKAFLKKLGFKRYDPIAEALYGVAVAEGRRALYYDDWAVPDTIDGRFDMISLMAALINRRIGQIDHDDPKHISDLVQELFDVMFADMDANLRELGVSDEGMKYRIKPMVSAHLGRVKAYDVALSKSGQQARQDAVADALNRNIYRTLSDADPMPLALRVLELVRQLETCADETILAGQFAFLDPAS